MCKPMQNYKRVYVSMFG